MFLRSCATATQSTVCREVRPPPKLIVPIEAFSCSTLRSKIRCRPLQHISLKLKSSLCAILITYITAQHTSKRLSYPRQVQSLHARHASIFAKKGGRWWRSHGAYPPPANCAGMLAVPLLKPHPRLARAQWRCSLRSWASCSSRLASSSESTLK
jgi:hypothetical protein